jgi:hypothetical protein
MEFWQAFGDCIRDRREHEHREWLTYDEYRVIFSMAHKAGLFAVYADENGEPGYRLHSPFGWALVRLYEAVKDARKRGISEQEFHREFCDQIDRASDVVKRSSEYVDQKRREAREKADQERRRGDRRQRVDPRDAEPDFPGVVVGEESARHLQLVPTGKEQG